MLEQLAEDVTWPSRACPLYHVAGELTPWMFDMLALDEKR